MTIDKELATYPQIKWANFKRELAKILCPDVFEHKDIWKEESETVNILLNERRDEIEDLDNQIEELENEIVAMKLDNLTELEEYCIGKFTEVSKFAYKDKRKHNSIKYAVYPNELIQPDKYLVKKALKEIGTRPVSDFTWAKKIGKYVDNKLKWTADSQTESVGDYYSSPIESLLDKQKDCEDHSFLAASLDSELLGVAFGYCGTGGHAWNVFMYEDELWCLETNSVYDYNNNTKVFKYEGQTHYTIHWIFTKDKTFHVAKKLLHFGIKV